MQLIRNNPWELMNGLRRDVDRFMLQPATGVEASRWIPAVDIKEEAERLLILADIPGVDAAAVEITLEDGVLTVEGSRDLAEGQEADDFQHSERARGSFKRRFKLPSSAASEGLEAQYHDGVLTISIPKKSSPVSCRIEVTTN